MQQESEEQLSRPRSRRKKREKQEKSIPGIYKGIMIVLLLAVSLTAGLFVGYSVVGKGQANEIFSLETYKHMYDLVFDTNDE